MAQLGAPLARAEPKEAFRSYAVAATMAGLVTTDRHSDAAEFIAAMAPHLSRASANDPSLRLLAVLARHEGSQQAAIR